MPKIPAWKAARCEWCAKKLMIIPGSRFHLRVKANPIECTAPPEADYIAELEHAIAVAQQFCGARGANSDLLDNLSALAGGDKPPHKEWPIANGVWAWAECGHKAGTACAQCLAEARIPKWIGCADRLPEEAIPVLVSNGRYVQEACRIRDGWPRAFGHITHWIPMPAPPKENA